MYQSLSKVRVMHARFMDGYEFARSFVARSLSGQRLIALLMGVSRVGKTLIAELLLEDFPAQQSEGVTRIPIVRVVTPTRPTKKSMAEAIIAELDSRHYGRQTAEKATARAIHLLKMAQVRVLLFDEVQHVVERDTSRTWYEVADWLKTLSDGLNLSLLLVGLPAAKALMSSNSQLALRAHREHVVLPYRWNDPDDIREFCRCLLAFSKALSDEGYTLPSLDDVDLVRRFYAATHGRAGLVVKLFEEARFQAHKARVKEISTQILANAYAASMHEDGDTGNPFEDDAVLNDSVLVKRYVALLSEAGLKLPRQKSKSAHRSGGYD